jgi:tRNA-Thr(GGU) m(6)t(6)A37 methyltransferase TsaA
MKERIGPFEFGAIGWVQSPFKDRFAVPRQPGLAPHAHGLIKMQDDPDLTTSLRCLDQFSHIWVVFVFHERGSRNWKPSVRPPRLGGAQKVGVLASRSPHRPNPIGLSVLKLDSLNLAAKGGAEISVSGLDLLDGTPVLDIKPYLFYADSVPEASAGWASQPVVRIEVHFLAQAESDLEQLAQDVFYQNLKSLIIDLLSLDPRLSAQKRKFPAQSEASWGLNYGFTVLGCDVKYEVRKNGFWVLKVTKNGPLEPV